MKKQCLVNRSGLWTLYAFYDVQRDTEKSFWLLDDKGVERRFNKDTGYQSGYDTLFSTYME